MKKITLFTPFTLKKYLFLGLYSLGIALYWPQGSLRAETQVPSTQASQETSPLLLLTVTPQSISAYEDSEILFTVALPNSSVPRNVFLAELDDTGTKVKYRWPMNDEGKLGDEKAGDGIYSRKAQFEENKAKKLLFVAYIDSQNQPSDAFDPKYIAAVEVYPQPTFISLLTEVWQKIKNHWN